MIIPSSFGGYAPLLAIIMPDFYATGIL